MVHITDYEKQYMAILENIYYNGYSDGVNERTGIATKRLPGMVIRVDVEKEFPILKSKFVAGKTSLREILWIWQQQSNNVHDLKGKIWDQWADENGFIGKAYGYQIAKGMDFYLDTLHKDPKTLRHYNNQANFVLEYLREVPNGRQCVVTLWDRDELSQMNLVPCCHTTTWNLDGGRLNCVLDQRSGDMPYGVPFNTTQYAELMILFARDLGVKPGILTHVIADAHIYDNQMKGVELQLKYYNLMKNIEHESSASIQMKAHNIFNQYDTSFNSSANIIDAVKEVVKCNPTMHINSEETDFFKINGDDISVADYVNMGKVDFGDVAV